MYTGDQHPIPHLDGQQGAGNRKEARGCRLCRWKEDTQVPGKVHESLCKVKCEPGCPAALRPARRCEHQPPVAAGQSAATRKQVYYGQP